LFVSGKKQQLFVSATLSEQEVLFSQNQWLKGTIPFSELVTRGPNWSRIIPITLLREENWTMEYS